MDTCGHCKEIPLSDEHGTDYVVRLCPTHRAAERMRELVTETHAIIRESWLTEAGRYEQIAALFATDEARALLRELRDGG